MNDYLEHGALSVGRLRAMIAVRELFPVYFGSALKLEGVEEFWTGWRRSPANVNGRPPSPHACSKSPTTASTTV